VYLFFALPLWVSMAADFLRPGINLWLKLGEEETNFCLLFYWRKVLSDILHCEEKREQEERNYKLLFGKIQSRHFSVR
jgi:hypothetical protein